jgi:hypothetical protein
MKALSRLVGGHIAAVPFVLLGFCSDDPRNADAAQSQPAQRDLRQAWCITGRVTDAENRPMTGVRVVAHTGMGTLHGGGMAVTDERGEYTLRFGPGMYMQNPDDPVGVQAANISPEKPGYFEKDLHRQGDLLMALKPPAAETLQGWQKEELAGQPVDPGRVVLPDQPRRIDFVMVPAAQVRGRMTTPDGIPLERMNVSLSGLVLPPCSSAAASGTTNNCGGFILNDIPMGTYWFDVNRHPLKSARSGELTFDRAGEYEVELLLDLSDPPRLTARMVSVPKSERD